MLRVGRTDSRAPFLFKRDVSENGASRFVLMAQAERIPADLREWIKDGNPVREETHEPFAGLCGALVKRNNGSTNGGAFCQRAAGWGTDHKGYGRCTHHEDLPWTEGLAPWAGPITDEEWLEITGGGSRPTHGASHLQTIRKSWEQWLQEAIPPEEWHAYRTMSTDPLQLVDQEIRLNRLRMARIHRWLRMKRMVADHDSGGVGGTQRDLEVVQAETQLDKLSMTFARLMEVRVRISEVAQAQENQDALSDLLRDLSDEDFMKVSSDHDRFLRLLNRSGSQHE